MEKNGRKIKNFIIACLLCIFPIISGVAINNNFLMNDNQIRYCTINEEFDFHLVKTQLQEKQELNSCQRYQSQEFSSIDTYSSLDYLNISEGFGIQYHVTDTYNGLDCSVWSIVQCYNRNKGNRDFVVTLIRSHDDEEYYCNSTLGGRVSYKINGRNLTFFQSGCPCGNQANFYMMFSLPRWFQDGDFWTFNDQEFNVQFIGTQIVNNIEFHDCIQINVDNTADDSECSEYLNGIGYFIVAKDVGIVKLVFNRTLGEDVCYEYISHQNMETRSIAGTILDTYGLPAQGISVQISNCDSCIRSIADESGEFEIETYGFDMILRIGYDLDGDGVIMDLYPDFPIEYPVTNITSDVTGLLIIVPSVQLINTVYVDDDYDENTPGWGYDHFDSIQDGINAVAENGIVYVFNGIYYENVQVSKSVDILGEDKTNTIIDGNSNNDVMHVSADDVSITGFTTQNSGSWGDTCDGDAGIDCPSSGCRISNCIFRENAWGVWLRYGSQSTIDHCTFYNNDQAVCLRCSVSDCIISYCTVYDCITGFRLGASSSGHTIINCVFSDIDIKAAIDFCGSVSDILVKKCVFSNCPSGVRFEGSGYNIYINENEFNGNDQGIDATTWATFSNIHIFHNNFIDNINHVKSYETYYWDDGYPSGGNYWDDYIGIDDDGDGIGDTPYNIPGGSNQDRYPYMSQNGWNQPQNNPPVANADGPYSGTINEDIIFDGSGSYDADGEIIGYRWDFEDDGNYDTTWLSNPTITHVYNTSGNYTITLQVLDSSNATDTDTAIVSISSVSEKPIADAGGPYYGLMGHEIFVNASVSYDVDGEITGYRWDFEDDGNYDTTWLSTPTTTFIYTKPGTYIIKLEVKDNGEATDTDTAIANIYQPGNCPPVPILGDVYYGMVSKSISFDASRSFDLDGKIIGYRWDFNNDGHWNTIWLTSPFETHVYFSEGVYSAKLMIMDNDGLTNTTTTLVKVSEPTNTPPSTPELPYPWNCSNDVCLNPTLSWQSSTDPDDDPISYDVYFGTSPNPSKASDGQVSTLFTPDSLMSNTRYYWYIVAKDNHDNEVKSDLWEFTTENKLSEIMVGEITGGANGVNVGLWNIGETYTSNIEWSMKFEPIDGGEILQPSNHFVWGMVRRPPTNHCTNISSGQLQGYGYFDITIIADDQTKTALGFVVLGYVSIIDDEI